MISFEQTSNVGFGALGDRGGHSLDGFVASAGIPFILSVVSKNAWVVFLYCEPIREENKQDRF